MVTGFVQQSGGRMRIGSKPGEGATIELILPSTASPTPMAARKIEPRAIQSIGKAVLLVDDDEAVRIVLGEQFREIGFNVDEAGDGGSAIERLKATADMTCCCPISPCQE